MPSTTLITANTILNRVAAEVGVAPVADPYASQDPSFVQMRYLLNTAGEELAMAYPWELLQRQHELLTAPGDTGDYPLPSDFFYMINQTGWERNNNVPLGGPLSAQDWQFLEGQNIGNQTIWASFRVTEGLFKLWPQPPAENLNIFYEYITTDWVSDGGLPTPSYKPAVTVGSDLPLFDRTLITRYLKLKFLEAKGMPTQKAQDDFNQTFSFLTGLDKGAEILTVAGPIGFPYLNIWRNVPWTRYGH
jgi:hypothetical protein